MTREGRERTRTMCLTLSSDILKALKYTQSAVSCSCRIVNAKSIRCWC